MDKTNLTSNSDKALVRARVMFGALGGQTCNTTKRLGIDDGCNNQRAQGRTPVARMRVKKALARAKRLKNIMRRVKSKAKRARAARKLFAGGVQAVAAFGCEERHSQNNR